MNPDSTTSLSQRLCAEAFRRGGTVDGTIDQLCLVSADLTKFKNEDIGHLFKSGQVSADEAKRMIVETTYAIGEVAVQIDGLRMRKAKAE